MPKQSKLSYDAISKTLLFLLLGSAVWWLIAWSQSGTLKDITSYHPLLSQDPEQTEIEHPKFRFPYAQEEYVVEPVANYEISGLVVSHNNVSGIGDAYHTSDSVDLKDLCLIWDQNLNPRVLRGVHFWSEPWTCFARPADRQTHDAFNPEQLSNNHLIGSSDAVRETIKQVRIGDQIQIKGYLINYYNSKVPEFVRKTSLIRSDDGNGACEVLFVLDLKILKQAFPFWRSQSDVARLSFLSLLGLKLLSFLVLPYLQYHRIIT